MYLQCTYVAKNWHLFLPIEIISRFKLVKVKL